MEKSWNFDEVKNPTHRNLIKESRSIYAQQDSRYDNDESPIKICDNRRNEIIFGARKNVMLF